MLSVSTSSSAASLGLHKAILVYGGNNDRYQDSECIAHATIHDISISGKNPVLNPGRLATHDDLKTLVSGLAESLSLSVPTWIEPTMLAMGAGRMLWYSPAGKRAMFFKESIAQKSVKGQGVVPTPGLVWMVMQGQLYVYAFKGVDRPTQQTKLYQAPFFNVWSQGKVCVGNAEMPTGDDVAIPEKWVKGFFGSLFTHPNFTQKNRLVKGICPLRFWKEMLAKPPEVFPAQRLVELPVTVGDFLTVNASDTIARIGRASGQF